MNKDRTIIIRGFNDGYLMQKHKPELATNIARSFDDPGHPYANGFIGGTIQLMKEQQIERGVTGIKKPPLRGR